MPDGDPEQSDRLAYAQQRMHRFVAEGVESAERGELLEAAKTRAKVREKQRARRGRKAR